MYLSSVLRSVMALMTRCENNKQHVKDEDRCHATKRKKKLKHQRPSSVLEVRVLDMKGSLQWFISCMLNDNLFGVANYQERMHGS